MNSWKSKPGTFAVIALFALATVYLVAVSPGYLTSVEYLGGLLLLEILAAIIWNYRQMFFPFLILTFLFAGTAVPMQAMWTSTRWLVLGAGVLAAVFIYLRDPFHSFGFLHLTALFCVVAAATSALVSPYPKHALLKALSLLLLFAYGSFGSRLAVQGREDRFFSGLLIGCETLIYFAAVEYFIFHYEFFGSRNSMGAVMGVAVAPLMLWGILVGESARVRGRRTLAFVLCLVLLLASHARAGISAAALSCILLCLLVGRYQMLIKGLAITLLIAIVLASVAPLPTSGSRTSLTSNFVFKGKEQGGVLDSRRSVWEQTMASIEKHPWFGGGFGTEAAKYDARVDDVANFSSNSTTTRERGSSYLRIMESVGLVGVVPFFCLVVLTVVNLGRVVKWLGHTRNPFSPAVPIAAVLTAGLIHAMFEDWLFAVGYYICIFFWSLAFMLPDFIPARVATPADQPFLPIQISPTEAAFAPTSQ
jgi:O-antigen ligase